MDPYSRDLIARAALAPGARCLDVGCGGGEVCYLLAEAVGESGEVIGVDIDEDQLEIVRAEAADRGVRNVTFECRDVTSWEPDSQFDVVYLRFILTHLPDPAGFLASACRHLRPGGTVLAEDIDFRGHLAEPSCRALERSVELYTRTVQNRGADPNIGPRLPGLLRGAGLRDVGVQLIQPAQTTPGGIKELVALTAQRIAATAIGDNLISEDEMSRVVAELFEFARDDTTLLAGPRVFQAWGTSSG
jgi:SAM-dependent methyltransferase